MESRSYTSPLSKQAKPGDSTPLKEKDTSRPSSLYDDYPSNNLKIRKVQESNQRAVLSAVKNLQEKILKLEHERKLSEEILKKLLIESNSQNDSCPTNFRPSHKDLAYQNERLSDQQDSVQSRCQLLEKQLSYLQTMVNQADSNMKQTRENEILTMDEDFQFKLQQPSELKNTMPKISTNVNLAEMKIQQLEEQLKLEQSRRQLVERKADKLQKSIRNKNVYSTSTGVILPKKVHTCVSLKTTRKKRSTSAGLPHYRLNLKNIPFIAGKATTPSHNIGSNLQEVISLLKTHNPRLCELFDDPDIHSRACQNRVAPSRTYSAPIPKTLSHPKINIASKSEAKVVGPSSSTSSNSVKSELDFSDILLTLQDEFGFMSFEQQEIVQQINNENNQTIKKELEKKLSQLSKRIDVKSRQIAKVKSHIEKIKKRSIDDQDNNRWKIPKNPESSESGEVLVITTVKTKGRKAQPIKVGNLPNRDLQLKMFKDIKTLQTTLKKDDICWE